MKTKVIIIYLIGLLAILFIMFSCSSHVNKQPAVQEKSYAMDELRKESEGIPVETGTKKDKKSDEQNPKMNTEEYNKINENEFKDVTQNPLSTFSIDVDKASYSNVRRYITGSQLPPKDAVRSEEMINYFKYDYPQPTGEHPFTINTEITDCPWNNQNKLVLIGLQGKSLNYNELKPCNLVFLIDCSGSMEDANKLPLLKKSLKLLVNELGPNDKVTIVAYAGAAGLVLPATSANNKEKIIDAMDKLNAGGSTAGGEGIALAYKVAKENLIPNGNNRVILCTDGDFNVGTSSTSELVRMIEEKRKDDIYITICGFGMGNYKDSRVMQIADAGNGNYFYIDNIKEAEKVFVKEMRANMFTIAKDVKIQIEFNPSVVKAYRLIGYEKRLLANEDFNDDTKDAGELGAGHTVTAMYEIIPAGSTQDVRKSDNLKYQQTIINPNAQNTGEIMTVKFRYKPPKSETSKLIEHPLKNQLVSWDKASENLRFAASVAGFCMLLRESKFKGDLTYDKVIDIAKNAKGKDEEGYRTEFIEIVKTCKLLKN